MRLVSRILLDRDLKPAMDRGVRSDWFANPEAKAVWEFSVETYQKHGNLPSARLVREVLPGVRLEKVLDDQPVLLDHFVDWHRRGQLIKMIQEATDLIETGKHEDAIRQIAGRIAKIEDEGVPASLDVDLTQSAADRIEEYVALRDLPGGMRGIPTGFPTIDRATLGLQAEQLVTLVATPKSGKSTLMMAMATNVHRKGKVPLFISFEMSNEEQAARHDAMRARISHTHLLSGQMTPDEEKRLRRALGALKDEPPFHLTADPIGVSTVSGIGAKVEAIQPDILLVDGVYLMTDEITGEQNTPQALTNITRNFKRMAQRLKIPVVMSTQALEWKISRSAGLTPGAAGYSSSFYQDSDVMLGLQMAKDAPGNPDPIDEEDRNLRVMASRNCPRVDVDLEWDWTQSLFRERDEEEDIYAPR